MGRKWREVADVLGFEPLLPRSEELVPSLSMVTYNDVADTLYIHFFERGQPAVSVAINEFLYLRVDDVTHRVIGLQIEGYLTYVVRTYPEWLVLADLADIPPAAIDDGYRRRAAVLPILKNLDLLAS